MQTKHADILAVLNDAARVKPGERPDPSRQDALLGGVLLVSGVLGAGVASSRTPSAETAEIPQRPIGSAVANVSDNDLEYMRLAIEKMRLAGVVERTGGPFGAVIVRDGTILAATGNSVMKDKDPSAHAEVNAIRQACRRVDSVDLTGAVLYSSCECCPMCYAAAYWARIRKIFYAAAWSDYDTLFDDASINKDMLQPYSQRFLAPQQILQDEARKVWQEFRNLPDGARY